MYQLLVTTTSNVFAIRRLQNKLIIGLISHKMTQYLSQGNSRTGDVYAYPVSPVPIVIHPQFLA